MWVWTDLQGGQLELWVKPDRPVPHGIRLGPRHRIVQRVHEEAEMTKYLAGVLSVIAAGVMLIAYGLLVPRDPSGSVFGTGLARGIGPTGTVVGRPLLPDEQRMW